MPLLPPAQGEEQLSHIAQQFAQWRQSRTTPRGRIPKPLWAQAIALTQQLPLARVAQQLGLTPQALKRRRDAAGRALAATPPPHFPHFVEVPALPWRTPTTEVEIQRVDGTRLRITYSETSPALAPLLQTFLESRGCCT
jgi:transposase-like protein